MRNIKKTVWLVVVMAIVCALTLAVALPASADENANVAKIGDTEYETLAAAIEAAKDGDTVTLIHDAVVTEVVTVSGKSITLDMSGNTLTSSANGISVAKDAALVITGNGAITTTGSYSDAIENSGSLTVESGTFTAVYGAVRALGGSTTVINGGTFQSSDKHYGVYYYANGTACTVTINNGTFKHTVSTYTENGKVTLSVNGGSFANDLTDFCKDGYGTILDETTKTYKYGSLNAPASYAEDENGNVTISDKDALLWFAREVDKEGNTFAGKTVTLAADIKLTDTWTPVGASAEKSFRGTFDGAGHTISGVKVSGTYQGYGFGFFGTIVGATVKNVTFDSANVSAGLSNVVGTVAGYSYGSSTFENVHVTNSTVYAFGKVGGIVGMAADPGKTTTLKGCSVEDSTIHVGYNGAGFIGLVQGECKLSGSYLKANSVIIDDNAMGSGNYKELDTTVTCDGSAATCAGKGTVIKGKYMPDKEYYWSAYSDLYNRYGDSSHDCTLANETLLLANSEVTHDAAVAVEMNGVTYLFSDLQGAFDFAKKGATVKLLSDITLTEQVNILTALDGLTLDGDGHTIVCATTTDPLKSGGSALYFGNASDKKYCTGIAIKNLTMTGTARFAIFLCGGTSSTFENVKISGKWYSGVNLYGTHGAVMTDCEITNETAGSDKYISAVWANVAAANPLKLVNTKVSSIAINAYTTQNILAPKIFVDAASEVGEIHTFDDGSVSGDKRLCVSTESEGTYVLKEYDNGSWVDIRVAKITDAEGGVTYFGTLAEAFAAAKAGDTITLVSNLTTDVTKTAAADRLRSTVDVTLDLAGYTLTIPAELEPTSNWAAIFVMSGTLTVRDSVGGGRMQSGTADVAGVYLFDVNGGSLIIESGDFFAGVTVAQAQKGTITVLGGHFAASAYNGRYDYMFNCIDAAYKDGSAGITIKGGTFEHYDPRHNGAEGSGTNFVAPGIGVDTDENGNFTAVSGRAAQIINADGSTVASYATLAEAIAAATEGQTVKLLADVTEDILITKSITLDLGGFTLTGTGASGTATLTIVKGATVTVKNGTILGTANSYYTIQNNGTATLENLTATAGNTASSMLDNWGTLTIESGAYTGGLNVVKSEEDSTLVINGGKFTRDYAPKFGITGAILVYGDTTINGGEFIDNATSTNSRVIVTGVVDGYTSVTRITGGTFTGKHNILHYVGKATYDNYEVSGGTFNKAIAYYYFADGYVLTKNSDGTYGAKEGQYVAAISATGTGYESLAEAIAAATKGQTVKLLSDVTEDILITKSITLDLNGKTLKGVSGTTITIAEGATVTVKNGTVFGTTSGYTIQNNGILTLTGITATAGNTGSSMLANFGTLTITSGTYTGGMNTVINKPGATLTINGGTFSTDYAENNAHTGVLYNLGNLTVKGGTFTHTATTAPMWAYPHVIMTAYDGTTPSTVILGGTFTSTLKTWKATVINHDGAGSAGCTKVFGGTFNMKVGESYCADGFAPKANDDGTYGVEQLLKIVATEGVLGENIKFYILTNRYGDLKFRIRVTLNGEAVIYEGVDYEKNGVEYYAYILDLPPQYLDATLKIELINNDDETVQTVNYSFLEYCEAVIKEDENAKQLVADLLWYSVAAKNKCGLNSKTLVTKLGKLGLVQSTGEIKATVEKSHTKDGEEAYIFGATLYHDSVNRIIVLVESSLYENTANYTYTYRKADGTAQDLVKIGEHETDGHTYVMLATEGIYANEFDTGYTIEISLDGTVVETLVYSINNYCEVKAESNELAKALYYYGVSAKAYKNS